MQKVLMVDDSNMIRMIVKGLLAQLKISDILEAPNGADALNKVREHKIDLILLDLHMPQMGGMNFLEELRKCPEFNEIPVIVISSDSDKKQVERAKDLGANAYVQKPLRLQGLQQALMVAGVL